MFTYDAATTVAPQVVGALGFVYTLSYMQPPYESVYTNTKATIAAVVVAPYVNSQITNGCSKLVILIFILRDRLRHLMLTARS